MGRLLEAQWKMREQAIVCIRNGRYSEAAKFIMKVIASMGKIETLRERERGLTPSEVEKMIRAKHKNLRSRYAAVSMNVPPMEIAKEVYNEIMLELAPESTNHRPLSEQLRDEEP